MAATLRSDCAGGVIVVEAVDSVLWFMLPKNLARAAATVGCANEEESETSSRRDGGSTISERSGLWWGEGFAETAG